MDLGYFVTVTVTGTLTFALPAVTFTVKVKLPSGVEFDVGVVVVFALLQADKPQKVNTIKNPAAHKRRGRAERYRDLKRSVSAAKTATSQASGKVNGLVRGELIKSGTLPAEPVVMIVIVTTLTPGCPDDGAIVALQVVLAGQMEATTDGAA